MPGTAEDFVVDIHDHFALDTAARHTRTAVRKAIVDIPDIIHAVRNPDASEETVVNLLEQLSYWLMRTNRELNDALVALDPADD